MTVLQDESHELHVVNRKMAKDKIVYADTLTLVTRLSGTARDHASRNVASRLMRISQL
jgi:hypothetical protein